MNADAITTAAPTPELWFTLLKSVAMLGLVLGILIAVLYLMRRFYGRQSGAADRGLIRMLATHHVAPKARIVLLDVLGEKILIGITSQQINCIANLPNSVAVPDPQGDPKPNLFSTLLANAKGKP